MVNLLFADIHLFPDVHVGSGGLFDVVLEGLVTYALHSTLLIAAVWLIVRLTPKAHHIHDGLWKVALVGGVLTAGVQIACDIEPLGGSLALRTSAPVGAPEVVHALPPAPAMRAAGDQETGPGMREESLREIADVGGSTGIAELPPEDPSGIPHRSPEEDPVAAAQRDPSTFAALSQGARHAGRERPGPARVSGPLPAAVHPEVEGQQDPAALNTGPWAALVTAFWVGGALLFLLHFFRRRRCLRRALGRRRPVEHLPTCRTFERLLAAAGIRRRVHLSAAPRLSSPVVLSAREICLPERALRELGEEECEAMLAHELAHVVRADPLWIGLCDLLESVFYFQPFNRVARRCWQRVSELLCDAWAVRHTGRGMTLARCLAEVASWMEPAGRKTGMAGMTRGLAPGMATKDSDLVRRVRRLLNEENTMKRNRSSGLALLTSVALLGLAAWSAPRALATQQETKAETADAPRTPPATPAVAGRVHTVVPTAPLPPVSPVVDPRLGVFAGVAGAPQVPQPAPLLVDPFSVHTIFAGTAADDDVDLFTRPPGAFAVASRGHRLGITLGEIGEALAVHLGIDREAAVLVEGVEDGSAADRAGLHAFDVIIRLNGHGSVTAEKLVEAVRSADSGKSLGLTVVRQGKPMEIKVIIGDQDERDGTVTGMGHGRSDRWRDTRFPHPSRGRAHDARPDSDETSGFRYRIGVGRGRADDYQPVDIDRLQDRLALFQERLEGLGSQLGERLGEDTEQRAEGLKKALEEWAARLEGRLEERRGALEERLEERAHRIAELFKDGKATNEALEKLGPEIEGLLEDLGPALRDLTDELGPAMKELSEELGPELGAIIEGAGPVISEFTDELGPVIEDLTKQLGPEASDYVRALTRYRAARSGDPRVDYTDKTRVQYEKWRKQLQENQVYGSSQAAEKARRAAEQSMRKALEQYQRAVEMLERLEVDQKRKTGTESGRKIRRVRIL